VQLSFAQPEERYAWIAQVLQRLGYRRLGRNDRGSVLAYLQRLSGYSRAQVTRVVARWKSGQPLVKNSAHPSTPLRAATAAPTLHCWRK